jgi:oligopeptide transport system substrate-binding protein
LNEGTGQCTYRNDYTRPPWVVTNGPYNLTKWEFKQRLLLEKSQTYWDREHVQCKTIEMAVNDNPLSQYLFYENGKVDWMADVPSDLAPELKAKGRTDFKTSPAFGTAFLTLLCRPNLPDSILGGAKNPLADVRVRQALAMAIDKNFLVNTVTRLGELPARTYLPPDGTLPEFRYQPGLFDTSKHIYDDKEMRALLATPTGVTGDMGPGLPINIEKARKLLADAGYPDGKGFPRLPILYNTDSTVRAKLVQAIKNQWKQALNIDIDINGIEGKIYKQRISKKEYAIGPAAWFGDYPDVSTFTDKYLSGSLQNDSDYRNPAYDDLCDRATREPDVKKRIELLSQAENMLDTEVPIIPMYHYVNDGLIRPYVHGVDPNPRGVTIFKGVSIDRN